MKEKETDHFNMLFELTSRIDERLKNLIDKQKKIETDLLTVVSSVHKIEISCETLTNRVNTHDRHWKRLAESVWKIGITTIAAIICYKVGINPLN